MLQIKDLKIQLRDDYRVILDGFNFSLNDEDKVGLIGEEGNGKSILLKTIYNKDEVLNYCDISGAIVKSDEIMAYLPQNVDNQYLGLTTQQYLDKNLDIHALDYNNYYRWLSELTLDEAILSEEITIRDLSGGEKIKFLLFVEMLKDPTVLLMDEPSNDLDVDSVLWLEKFMQDINIPLIFVSHDTRLLKNVANRIIHLEQIMRRTVAKHTIAKGGYDEYILNRETSIANETARAINERKQFDEKLERYRKVHDSVQYALQNTKSNNPGVGKNLKDKMHTVKSQGKKLDEEKKNLTKKPDFEDAIDIFFDDKISVPNGKMLLDFYLKELSVANKILAKNIELKIIGPEKICIIGDNGSGKTTLIKILMKELESLNVKVGYMPQTYFESEKKEISALEYLSTFGTREENIRISNVLGCLNFKREEMFRNISDLSGGQKAKVFFAKMSMEMAQVLVLDEPTRNLSPLSQPEIIASLKKYKGAIIAVSHDRDFIDQVFDKVYKLQEDGLKLQWSDH